MTDNRDLLSDCLAKMGQVAGFVLETLAPGRQAGFHVDRIVMRARRMRDLIEATSSDGAEAQRSAGLLNIDVAAGIASLGFSVGWSEKSREAMKAINQSARTVLDRNRDVIRLLRESPPSTPSLRAAATTLLSAAEELRTQAYAFEDGRRRAGQPPQSPPTGSGPI